MGGSRSLATCLPAPCVAWRAYRSATIALAPCPMAPCASPGPLVARDRLAASTPSERGPALVAPDNSFWCRIDQFAPPGVFFFARLLLGPAFPCSTLPSGGRLFGAALRSPAVFFFAAFSSSPRFSSSPGFLLRHRASVGCVRQRRSASWLRLDVATPSAGRRRPPPARTSFQHDQTAPKLYQRIAAVTFGPCRGCTGHSAWRLAPTLRRRSERNPSSSLSHRARRGSWQFHSLMIYNARDGPDVSPVEVAPFILVTASRQGEDKGGFDNEVLPMDVLRFHSDPGNRRAPTFCGLPSFQSEFVLEPRAACDTTGSLPAPPLA